MTELCDVKQTYDLAGVNDYVETKRRTPAELREVLEDKGCFNCGTPLLTRKSYPGAAEWDEWRCPDPTCPDSEEWCNIYAALEEVP